MGVFKGLSREMRYLGAALRTLGRLKSVKADSPRLVADDIEAVVRAKPDNIAFVFAGEETTYRAFDESANRIAHWAKAQGLTRGDTVALFMLNRPEYIAVWYGLSKVGVVTALINNQLVGGGLAHCINIAEARHVIVDADLADAVASARHQLEGEVTLWAVDGAVEGAQSFDAALADMPTQAPPASDRKGIVGGDVALKMYTSGTTGLPKAAKVTHVRALNYMNAFSGAFNATDKDRMLMVLPLYHATGGLVGIGAVLTVGGTVILEPKFSASRFWDVAVQNGATLFTYVGELCRFLTAAPSHPNERAHVLRGAVGNGLRPDVWERFQNRFNVPWIIEFYGATEGNVSLINFDGKQGAVGRVPNYLKHRFNVDIVKFDLESEEPVRGADGLCIRAANNEAGEAIGEIRQDDARFRFEGYAKSEEQTKKKILRDVFKKGDIWFRTGDLMRRDKDGYYYFVDRIGDTFRWKSENVATSEVSEAISIFPGVTQANVYGVEVPGYEGRAGMAAITADEGLDLNALHAHLAQELPVYARPLFVRVQNDLDAHSTGTFKMRKMDLVRDGFDPSLIHDPLYFADPRTGSFVPLDQALFSIIQAGEIRL